MTNIIYLIGKPGTGKYTIAQELAQDGYIICDNQLINNPVFSLLKYDGFGDVPQFAWEIINEIKIIIFKFLTIETKNNYVLTNFLCDDTGSHRTFNQVEEMASKRGSLFIPVKLTISEEENLKRIQNLNRLDRFKTIDIKYVYPKLPLIKISHANLLNLDVTDLLASQAAQNILAHVKSIV